MNPQRNSKPLPTPGLPVHHHSQRAPPPPPFDVHSCRVTLTNERLYRWRFPRDPSLAASPKYLHQQAESPHPPPLPPAPPLDHSQRQEVEQAVDTFASAVDPTHGNCPLAEEVAALCAAAETCWVEYESASPPPRGDRAGGGASCGAPAPGPRLVFAATLTSSERRWVHQLAEARGLGHASEASQGGGRRVVISAAPVLDRAAASSAPSLSALSASSPSTAEDKDPSSALFEVVGMVDGVSEELVCPGKDPRQWTTTRPVVVEVNATSNATLATQ